MPVIFTDTPDLSGLEILNARFQQLASTVGLTSEGRFAWNTTTNRLEYHDGTSVVQAATMDDIAAAGGGDMVAATYDPQSVEGDAFARSNMTGTQLANTISDLVATIAAADAGTVGGASAAQLRDRSTHTGQQLAATISDFTAAVRSEVDTYLDVDAANDAYDTIVEIAAELADLIAEDANLATLIDAKTNQYTELVGDGAATSIAVTHSLGNQYPDVVVWRVSDGVKVDTTCIATDANTTTVEFAVAPTTDQYRVVVTG